MTHRGVHRLRRLRRGPLVAGAVTLCLAGAGLAATQAAATPAAAPQLSISYQVKGQTTVKKQDLNFRLGPTQLLAGVNGGNDNPYEFRFTADLPLPPQDVSFTADGAVPETATVSFIQVGKVVGGLINTGGAFAERSRATYTVKLSDVTVGGVPVDVGDSCQTVDPVVVHASTPKGKSFDLSAGGTITSRYAIGDFANCGAETTLINQQIPGGGNFISLTLSDGQFVG